jgi:tetratricopeptide (TPR) repeat protein
MKQAQAYYSEALAALHQQRLEDAQRLFEAAIAQGEKLPEAYNGLGVVHQQQLRVEEAKHCFQQALQHQGSYLRSALFNLGLLQKSQGLLAEALATFRQGNQHEPNHAQFALKQAEVLASLGQPDEAAAVLRTLLAQQPKVEAAWRQLGELALQARQTQETARCYQEAYRLDPNNVMTINNLGWALQTLGKTAEALAVLEPGVERFPQETALWRNLGETYHKAKRPVFAEVALRHAVALAPAQAENHYQLGFFLFHNNRLEEAATTFQEALAQRPAYADAYNMLANTAVRQRNLPLATQHFRQAIALNPNDAGYYANLAIAHRNQGQYAEARAMFEKSVQVNPQYEEGHFGIGMLALLQGRFAEGWKYYEWRKKTKGYAGLRDVPGLPRWEGQRLEGRRLFVHAEQGFGDTFQFVRYFSELKKLRPKELVFCCDPLLLSVLQPLPEIDQRVVSTQPPERMDYHINLLSLPGLLGTTLETIPNNVPYLAPLPQRVEAWAPQLASGGAGRLRVGFAWRGRPTYVNDYIRSSTPAMFAPLFAQFPDITFYALQYGPVARDLDALDLPKNVVNLGQHINDFADTAAIVSQLDLVISTDTSLVHLAGALGVPVWVLLCFDPDWRWLLHRDDSPWYPSMRLFRQPAMDQWAPVVQAVAEALQSSPFSTFPDRMSATSSACRIDSPILSPQ